MTRPWTSHAALAVACGALALAAFATFRGADGARTTAPTVCIDQEARAELDRLRRTVAQRDALLAQRGPPVSADLGPALDGDAAAPASPPRRRGHAPRAVRIPNPAVSVTQQPDGLLDIRTTDPALTGSISRSPRSRRRVTRTRCWSDPVAARRLTSSRASSSPRCCPGTPTPTPAASNQSVTMVEALAPSCDRMTRRRRPRSSRGMLPTANPPLGQTTVDELRPPFWLVPMNAPVT
jgi:hypothetical protein